MLLLHLHHNHLYYLVRLNRQKNIRKKRKKKKLVWGLGYIFKYKACGNKFKFFDVYLYLCVSWICQQVKSSVPKTDGFNFFFIIITTIFDLLLFSMQEKFLRIVLFSHFLMQQIKTIEYKMVYQNVHSGCLYIRVLVM